MYSRLASWCSHLLVGMGLVLSLLGAISAKAAEGPTTGDPIASNSPLATQGPKPKPIEPPSHEQLQQSIARGVDFLLDTQFDHGAWGSIDSKKVYRIYSPVPGAHLAFRTAVTSLALLALLESQDQFQGERRLRVASAIDRGESWILKHAGALRRSAPDKLADQLGYTMYNIWGHAYAIQAIAKLHDRATGKQATGKQATGKQTTDKQAESLRKQLLDLMEYQVDRLARCTTINGGWGYYDTLGRTKRPSDSSMSFTTATVLLALMDAKALGVVFPEKLTQEAITALQRQRLPDFSYLYGDYLRLSPRLGINRPAASLGRSQACNLALRRVGDPRVTDQVLMTWLNRLFARNGWLSMGRKGQRPHESHFSIAGYFYYYGHYYAAQCIGQLPKERQIYFQDHLAHLLLAHQEKDGSWWDYPLYNYHQQYGTAMAISALVRCQHQPLAQ